MTSTSNNLTLPLVLLAGATVLAVGTLTFFLVDAHKKLNAQGTEIVSLTHSLEATRLSLANVEAADKDLKNRVAVLSVALQQFTNIRFDASGAIITRKGTRSDSVELR